MTKNFISFAQRVEIATALKDIVHRVDEEYCTYTDGWSDEKVAESMPFPCTVTNVGSIRREVFGKVKPAPSAKATSEARLEELAATVDEIKQAIQALNLRLAHVEKRLI